MRFAAALLLCGSTASALSSAGCSVLLDTDSLVGEAASAGLGDASSGNAGTDAGGLAGASSGYGGSSAGTGAGRAGGDVGTSGGSPNMAGGSGTSSCLVSNKGKEACDGIDNDCDPKTPDCTDNCTYFAVHGTSYAACDKLYSWQNAELVCLKQSMTPAQIDGALENQGVLMKLRELGMGPTVWLGAQDTQGNGTLSWLNGTVLARGTMIQSGIYQAFASGQPTLISGQSCLQMNVGADATGGSWSNASCSIGQQFVCKAFVVK